MTKQTTAHRKSKAITRNELNTLLNDIYPEDTKPMQHLFVEFAALTGLRVGDILRVSKVENIRGKDAIEFTEQKTGKKQRRKLSAKLQLDIMKYIASQGLEDGDYLFHKRFDTKQVTSRSSINYFLAHAAEMMSVPGQEPVRISPHSLRKFFGRTLYYENKVPLAVISALFNHSSVQTTMIYLDIRQDELDSVATSIEI